MKYMNVRLVGNQDDCRNDFYSNIMKVKMEENIFIDKRLQSSLKVFNV